MRHFIPRMSLASFLVMHFAFLISGATMAAAVSGERVFLTSGEKYTTSESASVYGAGGSETLVVQGNPSLQMDGNIERVELSEALANYLFSVSGTSVRIDRGTTPVVRFSGLNQPVSLVFSDRSLALVLNSMGNATLDGQALSSTPQPFNSGGGNDGGAPCPCSLQQSAQWSCDFSAETGSVSLTLETNTLGQLTASGSVGAEPFECTAPTTPGTITYQGGSGSDTLITRNLAPSETLTFTVDTGEGDDTLCLLSDFAGSVATGAGDDSIYLHPSFTASGATIAGGSGNNQCNNGPGVSWATQCSFSAKVPQACASAGVNQAAMFYQVVGLSTEQMQTNGVRTGLTTDGINIGPPSQYWMTWSPLGMDGSTNTVYGDPTFALMEDNTWILASRGNLMPSGSGQTHNFLYHAGSCPLDGVPTELKGDASASCSNPVSQIISGKTSHAFEADGHRFTTFNSEGGIYLTRLTDAPLPMSSLSGLCLERTTVTDKADIPQGKAVKIIDSQSILFEGEKLNLTDTTVTRRQSEWVMYIKGISQTKAEQCFQANDSLCEVCARSIFRMTSQDLLTWSGFERVVQQVSIPESYTDVSGRVWLYYQDFADACAAQDLALTNRAPISGRWEQDDLSLSDPIRLSFPLEAFSQNTALHYATNGNPIALSSELSKAAYEACVVSE